MNLTIDLSKNKRFAAGLKELRKDPKATYDPDSQLWHVEGVTDYELRQYEHCFASVTVEDNA